MGDSTVFCTIKSRSPAIALRWMCCFAQRRVLQVRLPSGVILTGMGKDGAEGMLELRRARAITLGQDEASSLIYGMPRAAFERGAVMHQYSLTKMSDAILAACSEAAPAMAGA